VRLGRLVFPLDRTTIAELARIGRDPSTAVGLAAGSLLRPVVGGLALAVSVAAVGGESAAIPVIAVAVLALVGGAISPTPGGLVVVECGAVVGLSFLGVEPVPAAAAVVVWRLTTFWLPMIPGAIATRSLRRRSVLA
jgi:glycosyltransferase 2 family protein